MLKKINKINIVFIIFCFLFLQITIVNAASVYQMGVNGNDLYFSGTLGDSSVAAFYIKSDTRNIGIGMGNASPTAKIHIAAGSATAGTAPIKLTSGTLLTTPETGAIEFDGTHYYATIGTTRYQLDQQAASSNIMDVNTLRASTAVITPNVYGSEIASGNLTLSSTLHATKGDILFGTSAYDEVNNRLGIGTTSPSTKLHVVGITTLTDNINYTGASYNGVALGFQAGDTNGAGVSLGAGGRTIVGSGESTSIVIGSSGISSSTESLVLSSDSDIQLITNLQNGWTYGNRISFLSTGNVGINNTAPSEKLEVTGNIKANAISGTAISASTQLVSTVATGTAPLSVTSTTAVANLNADLLDGNHSTAFSPVAGSSSITTVGTIGTGTWNATDVSLAAGGTNASLTAANGGVVYSTASAMAITAAGTSGQILKSNGAAAPTWVTLDMTYLPDAAFKKSVKAATTANITLSAPQTIDGISVVAGDRVLVKNQSTPSANGIYVVAAGAWTRPADADSISEIAGSLVNVDSGTTQGGFLYSNDLKTTDTLGTTSMPWYALVNDSRSQNLSNKSIIFKAGSATAGTAPIKLTAGTLMTTAENGAFEYDGTHLYFTVDTTRYQLDSMSSNVITANSFVANTAVSTPLIISPANSALAITPNAGYGLNINLSTTGDLAVNTDDLFVDTSTGNVGINDTAPSEKLEVTGNIKANAISGTAISASTQLTSTVATGTAPLSVTSTTKVTNLNVDSVDGYDSSNFSEASSSRNSIKSFDTRSTDYQPQDRNAGLYADFRANTANSLSDGGTYNGVLTFRHYGSAGDLSGGYPIQIAYTANNNLWTRLGTSATAWGAWNKLWAQNNDGSGSGLDADTLDGSHSTDFMGTAAGTINYLPKFTGANSVDNSIIYAGATGIGIRTNNPIGDLDIRSVADTSYGRFSFYAFDGGTTWGNLITSQNTNTGAGLGLGITGSSTMGPITRFIVNANDTYFGYPIKPGSGAAATGSYGSGNLYAYGNVGINNTSPSERLDVKGNIKSSGVVSGTTLSGSTSASVPLVINPNTTGVIDLTVQSTAGDVILSPATGYGVGIGTATPSQKLEVVGNMVLTTPAGNVRGLSITSDGGDYNKFIYKGVGGSGGTAGDNVVFEDGRAAMTGGHTFFKVKRTGPMITGNIFAVSHYGATDDISVYNNGNIGVRTSVPTAQLHISAGSATAGTAPLKLTPNANNVWLSTAEDGAFEYAYGHLYFTIGTTRYQLDSMSSNIVNANSFIASTSVITPLLYGSQAASGTLTLSSTLHATKGKILFGTSAYDEVNNRLGIGTTTPAQTLDVSGNVKIGTSNAEPHLIFNRAGYNYIQVPTSGAIAFLTNGAAAGDANSQLVLRESGVSYFQQGNVGIGTTTPGAKLEVAGDSLLKSASTSYTASKIANTSTGDALTYYDASDGDFAGSDYAYVGQANDLSLRLKTEASAGNIIMMPKNGTGSVLINGVGVPDDGDTGTDTPELVIYGPVLSYGSTGQNGYMAAQAFYSTSDSRLKTNIKPLENSLSKILKLTGYSFNWKADPNGKTSVGLIAQDVEKQFPELVNSTNSDATKSVQYSNMVAPLIEAIKEQQKQIEELKTQNLKQQEQIDVLLKKIR